MSVTAVTEVVVAEDDGVSEATFPGGGSFLDAVVARLSAQYGADPRALRSRAVDVLAAFAGARVQAFVPILVEKRLREMLRGRSGLESIPAPREEAEAVSL